MDAAQALADLTEISSQVVQVAILDRDGSLLATTISNRDTAAAFVSRLTTLLEEADAEARARGLGDRVGQLEASTLGGSVFAVRGGGRVIAATTRPDPTVGLVLYDLKRCLEGLDEPAPADGEAAEAAPPKRKRAPRGEARDSESEETAERPA
jgi:predicted regulator of Ras-like GTPase activity (Roadblock/LC7/MglB family)